MGIYTYKAKIYDNFQVKDKNIQGFVAANSFQEVINEIENYWGKDSIYEIYVKQITDGVVVELDDVGMEVMRKVGEDWEW